jgi:sulfopyruvate decarboxylase subunit beta
MLRVDALRAIYPELSRCVVVTNMGFAPAELFSLGHQPGFFYLWHSMGLASSVGLGIALSRPELQVVVIDGDGSLLMNLGSLATIGLLQPANLVVVVMDNEEYATTGGQPTPTAHGADLAGAARAMRIASAVTVRTEGELKAALENRARSAQASESAGPLVVVAKVDESAPVAKPTLDYVAIKDRFMTALGNSQTAFLDPQ